VSLANPDEKAGFSGLDADTVSSAFDTVRNAPTAARAEATTGSTAPAKPGLVTMEVCPGGFAVWAANTL